MFHRPLSIFKRGESKWALRALVIFQATRPSQPLERGVRDKAGNRGCSGAPRSGSMNPLERRLAIARQRDYGCFTMNTSASSATPRPDLAGRPDVECLVPLAVMGRPQFDRWPALFQATVDELFDSEKSDHIKNAAEEMANVIQARISGVEQTRHDYSKRTPDQRARYASCQPKVATP